MLRSTFAQFTMTDIRPDAIGLPKAAFERILHDRLTGIVSVEDFARFYHPDGGPESCCPLGLFAMLLLQFRYDVSDKDAAACAMRDLGWKYAMRLGADEGAPSVSSLKRFRAKVREHLGPSFVHDRVIKLAKDEAVVGDSSLQVVDSTNTDCRGAVLDTFNLIARALGQVLRELADSTGEPVEDLATRLGLSEYLARSIKGSVDVDWTKKTERNAQLTRQVVEADHLVALLRSPAAAELNLPAAVTEAVDLLAQITHQDVEVVADGTFAIREGTVPGRIISITDPEARHGRKSASKVINGHKLHVLATVKSQLVTAVVVTDASKHDGEPCADLIRQAERQSLKPKRTLGDLAYGGGATRRECAALGVSILTKVAASPERNVLPKGEFDIDLEAMCVTCPAGKTTSRHTSLAVGDGSSERVAQFVFDRETCAACPLAQQCCSATRRGEPRTVKLSPFEVELQQSKAFNATAEARELLRKRSSVERVISHLVRFGLRTARYFTQSMTQFQAYMTVAAYNLQRVATLLVARGDAAPR